MRNVAVKSYNMILGEWIRRLKKNAFSSNEKYESFKCRVEFVSDVVVMYTICFAIKVSDGVRSTLIEMKNNKR